MNYLAIGQGLFLVFAANGAPLIATRLFGRRFDFPLDCHARFSDGTRLLGCSKTFRGVAASLVCTMLVAPLIGLHWQVGALAALGAMAGDALSSFLKRRLKVPAHGMAPGVDQWFEALLPLLLIRGALGLTLAETAFAALAFWIGAVLLSRALFALNLRETPY